MNRLMVANVGCRVGQMSDLPAQGDLRETEFRRILFGFRFSMAWDDTVCGNLRERVGRFGVFRRTFGARYGGSEGRH